jgi:CheY-like chemotaxis protein
VADRPTILLAEDEVFIRFAVCEALRDEGYTVLEAANGEEALSMFVADPSIRLVVSDINMPGALDGIALATRIKAVAPQLPVLLVSAHPPTEAVGRADGFIRKPFSFSELVRQIQLLIGPQWKSQGAIRTAS